MSRHESFQIFREWHGHPAHEARNHGQDARATPGFTLIEVVVALGIFAIGMIAVIGLFTPVARSVTNMGDAEAAANVVGLLNDALQRRVIQAGEFKPVADLLKVSTGQGGHQLTTSDNNPNNNANDPRVDAQLLFANRDGTKIGAYTDPVWGGVDNEKFFEVALVRNEALSPNDPQLDKDAMLLAYTARIRWPAFVPDATPTNPRRALPTGFNALGTVRFDHSQKQVLVVAGSLTR